MTAGVLETVAKVAAGEVTAAALVDAALDRIAAKDGAIGAFLAVDADGARAQAKEIDRRRTANEPLGPLGGLPIAIKDMIVTRGLATTAASRILEELGAAVRRGGDREAARRRRDHPRQGQLRRVRHGLLDGEQRVPPDPQPVGRDARAGRLVGRQRGGGRCRVRARLARDRHRRLDPPARRVHRHRRHQTDVRTRVALRRDRVRVVARPDRADRAHRRGRRARARGDRRPRSPRRDLDRRAGAAVGRDVALGGVKGLKVGLPREYFGGSLDREVNAAVEKATEVLREKGAEIINVALPHTKLALAAYYLIAPAEASSNLARYDGVRYGQRADATDLLDLYCKTRGAGFGREVKRRVMLGTYALRSGYYDAYYKKAQQVRALIKKDFDEAFAKCDCIITPTTPTTAWKLGASISPVDMYRADIYTLACNLAGLPGISVPCGLSMAKLPIGAQLLGRPLGEEHILRAATVIEAALWNGKTPEGYA